MAQLDRLLDRYDLKTLEAAMRKRRAREDRKLARLETRRKELQAQLRKLEQIAGGNGTSLSLRGPRGSAAVITRRPNARRLNEISLAEALEQVMSARKKPIHYKELTDTVVKKKLYRTKSKNLLSTVAVTLKRDGRFKKIEPGIYALK
ncbi:MAG: winged helix-turn-helix domain-containing protein [bacterium]